MLSQIIPSLSFFIVILGILALDEARVEDIRRRAVRARARARRATPSGPKTP